jgi:FKBP-type peptidyl-prolyl cis-trans isomerase FkpA
MGRNSILSANLQSAKPNLEKIIYLDMLRTHCTRLLPALLLFWVACGPQTMDNRPLATQNDSLSYFVGQDLGKVYARYNIELDPALIYQGYRDILDSLPLELNEAEITRLSLLLSQRVKFAQDEKAKEEAANNLKLGQDFLRQNQEVDGIEKLASGIQYRVLRQGEGQPPTLGDEVRVSYTGRLMDGSVFTSTVGETDSTRILEIEPTHLLPGLRESLLLMKPGTRWEVFLPAHMGYGQEGKNHVPPNTVLIFDLELQEVLP